MIGRQEVLENFQNIQVVLADIKRLNTAVLDDKTNFRFIITTARSWLFSFNLFPKNLQYNFIFLNIFL